MTTLNTIIEEEVTRYKLLTASEVQTVWDEKTGNEVFLPDFLTTAMQRAYEAGREEARIKRIEILDNGAIMTIDNKIRLYGFKRMTNPLMYEYDLDQLKKDKKEMKKELAYCPSCIQMTNHYQGVCSKCYNVGSPTFYGTIITSPQWEAWVKHNEEHPEYDVHESMETGWMSQKHFQAFLKFCEQKTIPPSPR